MGHICVLELKHGSEVGGRARCWGDEEENGKTEPPKEVHHILKACDRSDGFSFNLTFTCFNLLPIQVTFVQLASGSSFTCGITLEQTVICWGSVNFGRTVPGIFTQITASEQYACGVKTDGGLFCWGEQFNQIDVMKTISFALPVHF